MTKPPPPSRIPASLRVLAQAARDWYDDWFNQFILNFLAALSWMTIILGPPMLFGYYALAHELIHGSASGPGDLLRAARKHFWASWQWALINLAVAVIVLVNIRFYWQWGRSWSIILASLFFFLGLFWAMIQIYVIPYVMAQKRKSLKLAFKNATLTFLAAPGYTILLFLVSGLLLLTSVFFILPLILAGPGLVVIIGARAVQDRLRAFHIIQ